MRLWLTHLRLTKERSDWRRADAWARSQRGLPPVNPEGMRAWLPSKHRAEMRSAAIRAECSRLKEDPDGLASTKPVRVVYPSSLVVER